MGNAKQNKTKAATVTKASVDSLVKPVLKTKEYEKSYVASTLNWLSSSSGSSQKG